MSLASIFSKPTPTPITQYAAKPYPQAYFGGANGQQTPVYANAGATSIFNKPAPVAPVQKSLADMTVAEAATAGKSTEYQQLVNSYLQPKSTDTSGVHPAFVNPATGSPYTVKEFVDSVAAKLPGDVPTYSKNALSNPNQTAEQVDTSAMALNNARNDIATGTTDPYKVASESGMNYTAEELRGIEKAYAGIYDPAIDSALAKVKALNAKKTTAFDTPEHTGNVSTQMDTVKGEDGYIDPHLWIALRTHWQKSGGSNASFESNFKHYLNPASYTMANLPTSSYLVNPFE